MVKSLGLFMTSKAISHFSTTNSEKTTEKGQVGMVKAYKVRPYLPAVSMTCERPVHLVNWTGKKWEMQENIWSNSSLICTCLGTL